MYIQTLLMFMFFKFTVSSQLINVTIPLNENSTLLYGDFLTINRTSIIHINFENIRQKLSFIIFQVHSHLYNVTVYNNSLSYKPVTGTNVGFYSLVNSLDTYYIQNFGPVDLKVYVAVHGYGISDPIPGGCSLTSSRPVPTMRVRERNSYIYVDVDPAYSIYDPTCSLNNVTTTLDFKMLYLPEKNFDADAYFDGIKTMLTPSKLRDQTVIPRLSNMKNRRMISAYPGTGAIYVAVVRDVVSRGYSLYVPSYSYGCSPLENDCVLSGDTLSHFTCVMILFVGIVLCYVGHTFFNAQMFFMGIAAGATLAYKMISSVVDMDQTDNLVDWNIDNNFWIVFVLIILLLALIFVTFPIHANILSSGFIGAYATTYSVDYYLDSNMKYIIINMLRSVTLKTLKKSALVPPYQWKEALVLTLWILLLATGIGYQYYIGYYKPRPSATGNRPQLPNYGTHSEPSPVISTDTDDDRDVTSVDERTALLS